VCASFDSREAPAVSQATGRSDALLEDGRLDSWKEIARHLGRSVLTAQRWEKSEGLPVHRHAHEKQASVYAYKSELDAWRASRGRAASTNAATTERKTWGGFRARYLTWRVLVAIAALLLVVTMFTRLRLHAAKVQWARQEALPAIEQLVYSDWSSKNVVKAYMLAVEAEAYLGEDARTRLLPNFVYEPVVVTAEPSGVDLVVWTYGGGDTVRYHVDSLARIRIPRTTVQWSARKEGYEPVGGTLDVFVDSLRIVFDRAGSVPAQMVRATGGTLFMGLGRLARSVSSAMQPAADYQTYQLADYWIDRFEVTNREFKRVVDAGGYANPEYWKEAFLKDGRQLSFAEAMRLFRDRTGRLGPATWEGGDFPEGRGDYPVTGVSWFEAMAYAAFSGKSLPSVFHWARAAGLWGNSEIVPRSNFSKDGLAPVGRYKGVNAVGTYDMAGNAKEWCFNATSGGRFILGGAWSEPVYMFSEVDAQSPYAREETFGFRLVKYITPPAPALLAAVDYPRRDYSRERPVSDAEFKMIRGFYSYDRSPLRATIDSVDDSNEHWRRETVSFDAAYGGERVTAWLFLPRHVPLPYQVVINFPGVWGFIFHSSPAVLTTLESTPVTSGRALVYPVYKGTFGRRSALSIADPRRTDLYREHVLDWYKDLGRTLDYVETRRDLDASRVAFLGFSWGARMAPVYLAVEPRLKTAVLVSGGLNPLETFAEVDPFNFASHVTTPVLTLNGKYDNAFPPETSQDPLFRLFAASEGNKKHVVFESGHSVPMNTVVKETLEWFDRYLGPVARAP